jgi:multiple sugar transport system permease protein
MSAARHLRLFGPGPRPGHSRRVSQHARRNRRREALVGAAFVLPYAIFLILFGIGPAVYALLLSFHTPGGGVLSFGLAGYRTAIHDPYFASAARNVTEFVLLLTPLMIVIVPLLALMLHARRGRAVAGIRLAYFLPGAVSGSVVVLVWLFMLDPQASPFSSILHRLGWHSLADVLVRQHYLYLFALMFLWSAIGGWIVISYGALKNIPDEIVGAARIDGCGSVALARHITLPMIRKTLALMTILVIAAASQVYTEPTIVGQITGGTAPWGLNQVSYHLAFGLGYFEASAAVAMMLVAFALVAAAVIVRKVGFFKPMDQ